MLRFFFILSVLSFLQCKTNNTDKEKFLKHVKTGEVVSTVVCKKAIELSYSIYLPTNYQVNKNWPIIYIFDPQGKGVLPIQLMKQSAEQLGYILVASNNTHNGLQMPEIQYIVNELIRDTWQNLSIDTRRVYLAGFSGGARIATMVNSLFGNVAGVISCSAGVNTNTYQLNYHLIGMAGVYDMNYLELKLLNNAFSIKKQPFPFIVFNGKHHWPPRNELNNALTMFTIYAMTDSITPYNNLIVLNFKSQMLADIDRLKNINNIDSVLLAYNKAQQLVMLLGNNTQSVEIFKPLTELINNKTLKEYLSKVEQSEHYEQQMQQQFNQAFTNKSPQWWKNELNKLVNDTLAIGLQKQVAQRLLGYISLSCYSYVNMAIQNKNWDLTKHYLYIYEIADPNNPDVYYYLACLHAGMQQPQKAITNLKQAIKLGFNNIDKIRNNALFTILQGITEYDNLLKN